MRGHDPRADNLLLRLFSYTPRIGRAALEDYCTEMLAWCLRNSPSFCRRFLNLTTITELQDWKSSVEVHTQLPFSGTQGLESDDRAEGNRFDLVLESGDDFVLVVESKVRPNDIGAQIEKYLRQLQGNASLFPDTKFRRLVTLTSRECPHTSNVGGFLWRDVYRELQAEAAEGKCDMVSELMKQFAEFLEKKGLAMLLKSSDSKTLALWNSAKKLELQLCGILDVLRQEPDLRSLIGRRSIKSDDVEWIGIRSGTFWVGFGINAHQGKIPGLIMWVELVVSGKRLGWSSEFDTETRAAFDQATTYLEAIGDNESANRGHFPDGSSWFIFAWPVTGKFENNANQVLEWFCARSRKAIELMERAKSES